MSHLTIFQTSHLVTERTENYTKFWYIIVLYGQVLVPLSVTLHICSLLIYRNFLLFIHTSVHFSLCLSFFYFFFCFPNFFVISPRLFFTLKIFLSFLSPPHCTIMTQYAFQSLLRLVFHAKGIWSLWMLILVRVISNIQFTIGFFRSSSVEDSFKQRTR